jgi:prepilin-type N-terminal cleavage/methylation domain-containing protein
MTSIKNFSLSKQEGFTTVELLVSMFIIAIIFVSSFQFFESYEVNTSELGEYESARFLAQSGIENEQAE